ncbi:MAG: hypothetical protein WCB61_21755, partial [Pseudolabrys sp.]
LQEAGRILILAPQMKDDKEARRSPVRTVNQSFSFDHQTCKKSLCDFRVRDWLLVRGDLRDKFVLTIQTAPKILDLRCIYAFIPLDIHRF